MKFVNVSSEARSISNSTEQKRWLKNCWKFLKTKRYFVMIAWYKFKGSTNTSPQECGQLYFTVVGVIILFAKFKHNIECRHADNWRGNVCVHKSVSKIAVFILLSFTMILWLKISLQCRQIFRIFKAFRSFLLFSSGF